MVITWWGFAWAWTIGGAFYQWVSQIGNGTGSDCGPEGNWVCYD